MKLRRSNVVEKRVMCESFERPLINQSFKYNNRETTKDLSIKNEKFPSFSIGKVSNRSPFVEQWRPIILYIDQPDGRSDPLPCVLVDQVIDQTPITFFFE